MLLRQLRRALLRLPPRETTCARRGFRVADEQIRLRFETVGAAFLTGYHAALECDRGVELVEALEQVAWEQRGFAFEGAALGFALRDSLWPWGLSRLEEFLGSAAGQHVYMAHVGVGWVWARTRVGMRQTASRLDPLLVWLAFDGWGFHEGFFHWRGYILGQAAPSRLEGYQKRAFDQGLGRAWWFVNGATPELIGRTINGFETGRQGDLWSGVGLAATYAGIVTEARLEELRERAGRYQPQLAQGAAFAAKARARAENSTGYTEMAINVLSGLSVAEAVALCDRTVTDLPGNASVPDYEIWRQRVQQNLQNSGDKARASRVQSSRLWRAGASATA